MSHSMDILRLVILVEEVCLTYSFCTPWNKAPSLASGEVGLMNTNPIMPQEIVDHSPQKMPRHSFTEQDM